MSNFKLVPNHKGMREMLNGSELQQICYDVAQKITTQNGGSAGTDVRPGKNRAQARSRFKETPDWKKNQYKKGGK